MKVTFKFRRVMTLALPATCCALAASTTACGDDADTTDDPVAGSSGSAGKGSGGSSGGGKTAGGTAGTESEAGSDTGGTDTGGTGGTEAGGTGGGTAGTGAEPNEGGAGGGAGEGGVGGEGPGPVTVHPDKINGADGTLVPQVHDLRGVTFASNGKIWAVGHIGANIAYPGGVDRQIAVVRFNADGSLDSTFDGDGIKSWNLRTRQGLDDAITNDGDEYCMGVKELPSGDVVLECNVRDASGKGRDAVLLKMNPSGALLNWSAGPGGVPAAATVRKVDFGWTDAQSATFPNAPSAQPTDEAGSLDISPDGTKIIVFGHGPAKYVAPVGETPPVQRTDNDRYILRLNATTGAIDATFNGGAAFTFNTGATQGDNSRRGHVEADGAIVGAGYTNIAGSNNIVVARLLPDGTPDATFTGGVQAIPGVFIANPFSVDGGIAECYAAVRQSSGRYVTTGYGRATAAQTPSTFVPPWLTTDGVDLVSFGFKQSASGGVLDETFGVKGTLAIQSEALNMGGSEDRGRDAVVLSDDRIVFAGRLGTAPAIFITTPEGELDATAGGALAGPFGGDTIPGAYLYAPLSGTTSHFYALALSKDGKRVAAVTNNHADGALLAVLSVE